jgi:CHAT domain-containing protein
LGAAYHDGGHPGTGQRFYLEGLRYRPAGKLRNRLYCNVGMTYVDLQQPTAALTYLDSARNAADSLHLEPFYLAATLNSGHCYDELGEDHFAGTYFRQVVELAEKQLPATHQRLSQGYTYLAESQRQGGQLAAALATTRQGLPRAMAAYVPDLHLHAGSIWQDSLLALSPGTTAFSVAADSALHHTRLALHHYREKGDLLAELIASLNLGELHRRLGNYADAEAILNPPISLLADDPEPNQLGNTLLGKFYINRGETRRDAGKRDAAFQDFRAALTRLVPTADGSPSSSVPDLSGPVADAPAVLVALQDLAEWHRRTPGDSLASLLLAVEVYDSALVLTERLRRNYTTIDDKIALAQQTRPLVDAALECYRHLADRAVPPTEYASLAYQLVEKRKAGILVSDMLQDRLLRRVDNRARVRLQELKEAQAAINERVHAALPGSAEQQRLRRAWADETARIRSFQDSVLRGQSALRTALKAEQLLTATELRHRFLAPDQALLSYHYQPGQLDVFLLTPDRLRWRTVALAPDFAADVDTLNRLLAHPRSHPVLAERQAVYCAAAYRVSQQLFPDFGIPLPERLIIVPDAPFLTLPFEALWTHPTPGGFVGDAPTDHFLLQQHVISYAYSANLLAAMSRDAGSTAEPGLLAGFAARFPRELAPGRQPLLQPVTDALPYLTPLPGEGEIEQIAEHTNTRIYAGPEANRFNFERTDQRYQAVHVITHGIINETTPLFNFISFSQLADTLDTDQLLFLQDLYAQGLDLELASFSACQTAQGRQVVGEGPMSLARGLAAAGVNSVLTQLWRVSIDDTKDWMPLFYQAFTRSGGAERDRALTQAKRSFIQKSKNHRDPSTWASGVLIGYGGPLALQPATTSRWAYWWAIPIGLGLFLVVYWRRRGA